MTLDELQHLLDPVRDSAFLPLFILAAFLVAGVLFLSVWLVIFQTGLLVAPPFSFALALAGAVLSASVFWFLGRFCIGRFVMKRASVRVLRAVQGAGLEGIIALRVLPILPFTLVNLSAGALGVPYRTFFAGTVVGMSPGILAVTLLGDRALAVLKDPSPTSIALLFGAAALLVAVATGLRRLARRRQERAAGAGAAEELGRP
jgi:phospholipase D1/2